MYVFEIVSVTDRNVYPITLLRKLNLRLMPDKLFHMKNNFSHLETYFRLYFIIGIFIGVVWGCSKLQEDLPMTPQSAKLTYQKDIRPILMVKCASCHNQSIKVEGNYDVSSIQGLMGKGTDAIANAIPGNANSILLTAIQPGGSMAKYASSEDINKIRQWIVIDNLYLGSAVVHPQGWSDPKSSAFHGKSIKDHGWDMSGCADCHGSDFKGGIAGNSCESCHSLKSPGNCTTCHGGTDNFTGAPPKNIEGKVETSAQGVGAHTKHVEGKQFTQNLLCNQCHVVPDSINSAGHIDKVSRAEVLFSGIPKARGAQPEYTYGTVTCSGVYCHGNFGSGNHVALKWTDAGSGKVACGSCHSLPPQGKSANGVEHDPSLTQCSMCHPTADENNTIVRKDLHINGTINLSLEKFSEYHGKNADLLTPTSSTFHGKLVRQQNWDLSNCKLCHGDNYSGGVSKSSCNTCHTNTPEDCLTCHGGLLNTTGSPPPDINGNTTSASRGVGAHASYFGITKLSNNVKCASCHVVPKNYFDPGHIDSPSPAEVIFKDLSTTKGAQPVWDTSTLRCSLTYCHGNFPGGNKDRVVKWTNFSKDAAACGTCHGLPPEDPTRSGYTHQQSIRECENCHANVVGPNLKIINKDLHINGRADQ